jgi:GTPase SAR1 family protein/iron-sulfur cluster repair protein YtfE (RIC family)
MLFLSQSFLQYRDKVEGAVGQLYTLTQQLGKEEFSTTVLELQQHIRDPFMFVVVGEVKAGKSSFINALLESREEICKVSPAPMTDSIQQLVYGEKEETVPIGPFLKKIYQPAQILKEIAIVDTPGTNTIISHHQAITESFIPSSDLIVFVFEAKNPYRQSAWDFLDFIHASWRRKVIFVLQQKDLLSQEDLVINLRGVAETAQRKGMVSPVIFAVSAKLEQEGRQEESGFTPLRDWVRQHITGGKAPMLKLHNTLQAALAIQGRIQGGLVQRRAQLKADTAFRTDIRQTLNHQEKKSAHQVDMLVENLLASYDRISKKYAQQLGEQLSFFTLLSQSFKSLFSTQASPKHQLSEMMSALEQALASDLRQRLDKGVHDIADSIQQMARLIDLKLQQSSTVLKNDHNIFADIAERRSQVLRELQEAFRDFLTRNENFTSAEVIAHNQDIAPNVATGGGLALVGVVLAALTNSMVFDVKGGILTGLGLLFAGLTLGVSRQKILKGYHQEIWQGREKLETEVNDRLKTYIRNIRHKMESNFAGFDALLTTEAEQLHQLETQHSHIADKLEVLLQENI